MTWTKLGDEYGGECWELSDAAFRLHIEGLVWSNGKALDGRLAKTTWCAGPGVPPPQKSLSPAVGGKTATTTFR